MFSTQLQKELMAVNESLLIYPSLQPNSGNECNPTETDAGNISRTHPPLLTPLQAQEMLATVASVGILLKKSVPNANTWWTKEIENLFKKRNHARNQWMRKRGILDAEARKKEYKAIEKEFNMKQTAAANQSFREFFKESSAEGPFALYYKVVVGKISPPTAIVDTAGSDGTVIGALRAQAEKMFPQTEDSFYTQFPTPSSILPDEPLVTIKEAKQCLEKMARNKAPGYDLLTSEMLSAAGADYLTSLVNLYNDCLTNGEFPQLWKKAVAAIVPKTGKTDMADLKSYRPVSLLPILGKLLDNLMKNRLNHFLESRQLLMPNQYGFRQQKSTVAAIEEAVAFIEKDRKHKHVLCIALDISAAFDTAKHSVIAEQLNRFQVPNNLQRLLSYRQISRISKWIMRV